MANGKRIKRKKRKWRKRLFEKAMIPITVRIIRFNSFDYYSVGSKVYWPHFVYLHICVRASGCACLRTSARSLAWLSVGLYIYVYFVCIWKVDENRTPKTRNKQNELTATATTKSTKERKRKEKKRMKHKTTSNEGLNVSFRMEIEFYHLFAI